MRRSREALEDPHDLQAKLEAFKTDFEAGKPPYSVPRSVIDTMQLKNDLPAFNSDTSWTLPMPGRFVIGQDRAIRYAEVNPDYTHRPEPGDMLPAVRSLRVTRAA